MYVVFILEEALEDLTTIVAYLSAENVAAAETLGNELIDQATSLELMPYRGSVVKRRPALRKLTWEMRQRDMVALRTRCTINRVEGQNLFLVKALREGASVIAKITAKSLKSID